MNNAAKEKARQLRYKKAALARLNLDTIRDELSEISENCDNVRYFIEDDSETLLAALDGDEEEEYEFKMMFFDLSSKCDRLSEALYDGYVTEYFDDFLCPFCKNKIISRLDGKWTVGKPKKYCDECGQALDWSDA